MLVSKFWWGQRKEERKIHWLGWNQMCKMTQVLDTSKALAKALLEHVEDDSTSNKAARRLAQEAKTPISFDVWLEDYPVFLQDFV
ncbi:hypothetical protein FCV25MIE_16330 [Fagus crenata]